MSKIKSIIWPQVVLFGDSITQFSFQVKGWGSEIANKLARKCDVVNRGLSGYNTRWAKLVVPRLIPHHGDSRAPIAAVTVFFGANDSALEGKMSLTWTLSDIWPQLAFLKTRSYSSLLHRYKRNFGKKECILKGCSLNRLNSVAGQYAQVCVQTARQCGVDVIDLWSLMQKDGEDFSVYLSDGLHLSEKGNQFVAEHVWRLLESRVADLPFILPYWADVDCKNPENSLLGD
ncbi:isoamyl acetate-hydrolyzing esterase 1-like [Silurus asotus]|uniref:1-alkyl-2-acetylglycerophosphocholine esterase n=1 Tax=Silurus asotus TaxID=30991 RepID=A0AAD5FIE5_SILAS|nr:isoamyl acetate-hydrolyzing esterase 1-like [Silurus asotus]